VPLSPPAAAATTAVDNPSLRLLRNVLFLFIFLRTSPHPGFVFSFHLSLPTSCRASLLLLFNFKTPRQPPRKTDYCPGRHYVLRRDPSRRRSRFRKRRWAFGVHLICEGNAKQMNSTKGGLATTARAKVGRHDRALLIGAITNRHVRKVKRIHVSWVRSMQPCSAAKDSMQESTETEPLNH